ncbi:MAG: cupin domain-containing protein [Rhizobiaceae bacterium]
MSDKVECYSLDDPQGGVMRKLAAGMTTQIFSGEKSMLSVVTIEPHAKGEMHHHPEEQWGIVLEGSAVRFQGEIKFEITKGISFVHRPMYLTPCKLAKTGYGFSTYLLQYAKTT